MRQQLLRIHDEHVKMCEASTTSENHGYKYEEGYQPHQTTDSQLYTLLSLGHEQLPDFLLP